MLGGVVKQHPNPPAEQPPSSTTESSTDSPPQNPSDIGTTNDLDEYDFFQDILETKPILPKATPDVRDISNSDDEADIDDHDATDNTSTTALFTGHGREEGAGPYYSSKSDESSTGKAG